MEINPLAVLDYMGVAMFAASGALMAANKRQDVVTFIFFAAITGVGGGTLRDLLINAPVFWVQDAGYVIVCTVVAILIYLTRGRGVHEQTLLWLDAVGLCIYACVGAAKALAMGVDPVICVVMGALTATFDPVAARALHHAGDRKRGRLYRAAYAGRRLDMGERHSGGAGLHRSRRRHPVEVAHACVRAAREKGLGAARAGQTPRTDYGAKRQREAARTWEGESR